MLPYSSWFFDTSKTTASTHHRTQVNLRHYPLLFGTCLERKRKRLFAAHGSRAMMLSQKNWTEVLFVTASFSLCTFAIYCANAHGSCEFRKIEKK